MPHHRELSLTIVILTVLWADVFLSTPSRADQTSVIPQPTERVVEYGKYRLVAGREQKLCRALGSALSRYSLLPVHICAFPIENDGDFLRPTWETLDPLKNLKVLKQIYAWTYYGTSPRFRASLQSGDPEVSSGAVDDIWKSSEAAILQKVSKRDIVLQRGRFDLNDDGREDVVYRMGIYMKPVNPLLRSKDGKILYEKRKSPLEPIPALDRGHTLDIRTCQAPLIDGIDYLYHYFVRAEDDIALNRDTTKLAQFSFDVFVYEKATYLAIVGLFGPEVTKAVPANIGNEVAGIASGRGLLTSKPVCDFAFDLTE